MPKRRPSRRPSPSQLRRAEFRRETAFAAEESRAVSDPRWVATLADLVGVPVRVMQLWNVGALKDPVKAEIDAELGRLTEAGVLGRR